MRLPLFDLSHKTIPLEAVILYAFIAGAIVGAIAVWFALVLS